MILLGRVRMTGFGGSGQTPAVIVLDPQPPIPQHPPPLSHLTSRQGPSGTLRFVKCRTASVTFALPEDTNLTTVKDRTCLIIINQGPNGTAGTFTMAANALTVGAKMQVQDTELVPFADYTVTIDGWTHWTDI